jgi:hypothetical protein
MTKREFEDRSKFAAIVREETKHADAVRLAELIMRHGVTYARLQEMNCNGVGTFYNEDPKAFARKQERFEKWVSHRETLIENRIGQICAQLGCEPIFQGDPRGNTIKLKFASGRTNDYAREGVSVPTS